MTNKLVSVNFIIGKQNYKDMYAQIKQELLSYPKLFSYIIYNKNDKRLESYEGKWFICCTICTNDNYNTLQVDKTINNIIMDITQDNLTTNISGFKQPPVEISFEMFNPLLKCNCSRF